MPNMSAKDFDVDKAKRRYRNYPAYGLGLLATKLEMFSDIEVGIVNLNHEIKVVTPKMVLNLT